MEQIIKPLKADVFMQMYTDNKHDDEIQSILDFYRPVSYILNKNSLCTVDMGLVEIINKNKHTETKPLNVLSWFSGLNSVLTLKKDHELSSEDYYDIVIRCRYDLLLITKCPIITSIKNHITDLKSSIVLIPNLDHWGGYNDRFAIGTGIAMDKYMSIYNYVSSYISCGYKFHPESYIKHHLDSKNVKVLLLDDIDVKAVRAMRGEGYIVSPGNACIDKNGKKVMK